MGCMACPRLSSSACFPSLARTEKLPHGQAFPTEPCRLAVFLPLLISAVGVIAPGSTSLFTRCSCRADSDRPGQAVAASLAQLWRAPPEVHAPSGSGATRGGGSCSLAECGVVQRRRSTAHWGLVAMSEHSS